MHRKLLLLIPLLFTLLGAGTYGVAASAASSPTLADAQRRWEQVTFYRFSATIDQEQIPAATLTNVGQTGRRQRFYLSGEAWPAEQRMEASLWTQGGDVRNGQGKIDLRLENGRTWIRAAGADWQPLDDFSAAFAPNGDWLALLTAAQEAIVSEETGQADERFTRYPYRLDGPRMARAMQEWTAAALSARGELPPGVEVELPAAFRNITGVGELWVDEQGLPARNTLTYDLPGENGAMTRLTMQVDFSDVRLAASPVARALGVSRLPTAPEVGTRALPVALVALVALVVARGGRSRRVRTVVSGLVIASTLFGPLAQSERAVAAAERRQATQAQQQARQARAEAMDALQEALAEPSPAGKLAVAGISPLEAARADTLPSPLSSDPLPFSQSWERGRGGGVATGVGVRASSHLLTNPDGDDDGDGLTNAEEERLGTSSISEDRDDNGIPDGRDSDADGVSDYDEVTGFFINDRWWYGDPLLSDTNNDGLPDGLEWNLDTDSDSTPDLYDDDNDGDGVPDAYDLSPFERRTAVFARSQPLEFSVNGFTPDRYLSVEYQLRPTNPNHLWYALTTRDWPRDEEGQMQDRDGKTFLDVNPDSMHPQDAYGDVRLVPMLEIEIPGTAGPSHLATTTPYMSLTLDEYTDPRYRVGTPFTGTVTLRRSAAGRIDLQATLSRADALGYHRLALYNGTCERPQERRAMTRIYQTNTAAQFAFSFDELANQPYALLFYHEDEVAVLNNPALAFNPLHLPANYGCADIPAAALPFEESRALMADPQFYEPYGASVIGLGPGQGRTVYLPLQLATDSTTGAQLAFQGRMVYRLRGNTWGAPHKIRLVWAVIGMSDRCSGSDCRANQTQILTIYPDEWQLTGLRVREDHGMDVAIIYEDPTVDPDLNDDNELVSLALGLEDAFLSGRDCQETATGVCNADGQRDITVSEIYRRFDRDINGPYNETRQWAITDTLQVETHTYTHLDAGLVALTGPDVRAVLSAFDAYRTITPTLLFVTEERFRLIDLQTTSPATETQALVWNGAQVTFNFASPTVNAVHIHAGLKWTPYHYNGDAWKPVSAETYLAEIERRYPLTALIEQAGETESDAEGKQFAYQLYYLALLNGVAELVQVGDRPLRHTFRADTGIASYIKSSPSAINGALKVAVKVAPYLVRAIRDQLPSGGGSRLIQFLQNPFRLFSELKQIFIKAWDKIVSAVHTVAQKLRDAFGELKSLFKGLASLKGAIVVCVVVAFALVIAALVAATAASWLAAQLGGPEWLNVVAGVGITAGLVVVYLGLIKNFSVLLEFGKMLYSIFKTGVETLTALKNMARAVFAINSVTAVFMTTIGFLIEVVATVIFLLVVYLSGQVEFFSIAGRILLVESLIGLAISSIFTSITLILIALGAILGGVGMGVVLFALGFVLAVVSLVDITALVLCKAGVWDAACGFSLSGNIISYIRQIFYHVGVLTEAGNDLLQIRGVDLLPLPDQYRPLLSDGSAVVPVLHLRHWAKTPLFDPGDELTFNEYLATAPYASTQNQTSLRYTLAPYTNNVGEPELGEMTGDWFGWHKFGSAEYDDMVSGRTVWRMYGLYALRADRVISATEAVQLSAGLNRPVVFWLSTGIALPGAECWFGQCTLDPVRTTSVFPIPLTLDVFPATLDEFVAWTWDPNLPPLLDRDGDGLKVQAFGGNDPNDALWDSDGDGVSDLIELRRLESGGKISPIEADSDHDGLSDAEELRLGSDPNRADTDGDGLTDREEVQGWTFTYNINPLRTAQVTSDPLTADSDGDGMSDALERTLHLSDPATYPFHPRVYNAFGLSIAMAHNDTDGYLARGQSLTITTTVRNTMDQLSAQGTLTLTRPTDLGGGATVWTFGNNPALAPGAEVRVGSSATVAPYAPTQVTALQAALRAAGINPDGSRLPGDLTASAELTVTVDADLPEASITWPALHAYLPAGRSVVIGGVATDTTSYIERVEARADNGAWQTANGRELWSAAVPIPAAEGLHTLWVRATDAVGNVQSAASQSANSVAIYADGTPPTVNAVIAPNTVLAPLTADDGRRQLTLRFTAADPNLPGGLPGSGVALVEMDLAPHSAGWQAATLVGSEWVITYTLPAADADGLPLLEPNGVYTALVRAADTAGNVSDAFAFAYQVDGTAPRVEVQYPPRSRVTVISNTLVLDPPPQPITGSLPFTGTVVETETVRSGVQSLDVRLTPADLGVAPGLWRGHFYDQSGAQTSVYTVTSEIDADWGSGAPAPDLNADAFIAEWQQEALLRVPGVYTFTVTKDADSAVALWVDGALRLSAPVGQTSAVLTLALDAGEHPLRLRYNETSGEARVRLVAELAEADWQAATLAQSGAGVDSTTWQYQPPTGMEGLYRLDARAADVLGNVASGAAWRGEIDTAAPRVALEVSYTGVGATAQTRYRVWINDFNLVAEGLQSPCGDAAALHPYYYDTAWWREMFGETHRLYQLYGECSVPGYVTTPPTVTAYDRYGRVTTLSAPLPEAPNTRGLYWNYSPSADGGLYRLNLNTAENTHLLDLLTLGGNTLYSRQNLKVHPHSERLYAALPTADNDRIWRLGLDGSNPQPVITRIIGGNILAVALTRDHLYWLERGGGWGTLLRADLDGGNVITLTTTLNSALGLAADPLAGVVFVAENGGRIHFFAESGESGAMTPTLELGQPIVDVLLDNGMAADPQARMLYVTGERTDGGRGILRIPYPPAWSGDHTYTEATLVVPSDLFVAISGLAVDGSGGKLYFGTLDGSGPYTATLRRANLDGSDLETVYAAPGHLFWTLSLDLDINHPPTATTQIVQVAHNTPLTFTLDARDPDGNPLTFALLEGPEGEINLAATVTYTPTAGFAGQDRFTYRVEDNRGAGATGEVILNVWPATPVFAAVNAPQDNAVVAPGSIPITLSGYALHEVQALTLTVDGAPVQTWTYGPGLTEASETHPWAAAAGLYTLRAQVRDRNGNAAESAPTRLIVDSLPPTVTVNTVYTSAHALPGLNAFTLRGSAGDDSGIARVDVGTPFAVAQLDATPCPACGWQLAMTAPAGVEPFTLTVRATDLAGRITVITPTIVADLYPPEAVTVTLAYTDGLGQRIPLSWANPVIREANRPLIVEWEAAGDGSGIEGYYVGWTSSPTPTLAALTRYAPDAPRRHEQIVGEAQVTYAHLVIRDGLGNERVQTFGPYLVDSPLTPDLIGASDDGVWYSHWLESGASLLSRERSGQGTHRLYGSWNADALQLTWIAEDGDWDVHGDLWFYLDTQAGGTTVADQPYAVQGWQDEVAVTLPFAADYAVHVRDAATAVIKQWDGSAWITATVMATDTLPSPSGPPVYRLVGDQLPRRTDLYIPLGYLGTGAANPLRLAAFVVNEPYMSGMLPCLLVGAPDLNPLNCGAEFHPLARAGDIHTLTLTQYLAFDSLPAGVLPNAGRYSGAAPAIAVDAQPRGAVVGYLQSDRYDVLTPGQPIDADLDGVIDHPITGIESGVVGDGQTVTYTVVIRNGGEGAMPGVVITATARGALELGTPGPYSLGTIAPGQAATLTLTATVNTALNPNAAELMLAVDDATHRPFEWFWVHHAIDSTPPQAPRIAEPLPVSSQLGWALALPFTNTVSGWVYDEDVARLQLEAQPLPSGSPRTFNCPYGGGYAWSCAWDAGTSDAQYRLQVRAQDAADNWSAWSEPITVAVDVTPPQIALDAYSEDILANDTFGGLNWPTVNLSGVITDNLSVAGVLACRVEGGVESCQSDGALFPSPWTSRNWWLPYTIAATGEGVTETVRFYAVDGAGHRSQPLTRTLRVDTLAPRLTVTQVLTEVWREDYTNVGWGWFQNPITETAPVLTGTLSEAALAWADLRIEQPDGGLWTTNLVRFPDGRWHGVPQLDFSVPGVHTITVRAVDVAGNWTVAGPFSLLVKPGIDLALSKSVTPIVDVHPGDLLTYTLVIINRTWHSPELVTNVRLTDTLPSAVTLVSPLPPECSGTSQVVCLWPSPGLGEGEALSVTLVVRISPDWDPTRDVLLNRAEVSADGLDARPEDNVAQVGLYRTYLPLVMKPSPIALDAVDLSLSKSVTPTADVRPGDRLTYTLVIANRSAAPAANVRLTDTLPLEEVGLIFPLPPECRPDEMGPTVICEWPSLDGGESVSVTLAVYAYPHWTGKVIVNRAEVSADNPESQPEDNAAQVEVSSLDLALTKSVTPTADVRPGDLLTYTLVITNRSWVTPTLMWLTDTLPSAVAPVSMPPECSETDQVVCEWSSPTLGEGESLSVTLVVQISPTWAGELLLNRAEVSADDLDAHPEDNVATAGVGARRVYLPLVSRNGRP